MDKKRRNNMPQKQEEIHWEDIISPNQSLQICGILYKSFHLINTYGKGSFEYYLFDGLYISIIDVHFICDLNITTINNTEILELSFLIEGEQIINFDNKSNEIIYEGQESYMINSTGVKTTIAYPKEKRQKEIKIRIDHNFIKKHHIDEAYTILENHLPFKLKNDLSKPLCVRTQEIISEIATDKRSGLLKRLFLESKTLELIALQLDLKSNIESNIEQKSDSLVKKLYKVQHIINSDLTSQYVIQQLAREVGLNDFVLKKEFKRVFNQTVFEYASHVRMSKAKQLLLHTDKPIYEISEIVGYKNATHFSAAFKKTEKITPKKYRGLLL